MTDDQSYSILLPPGQGKSRVAADLIAQRAAQDTGAQAPANYEDVAQKSIVSLRQESNPQSRIVRFEEVVPSVDDLMGVKAVFGTISSRVMCFGSRGDERLKNPAHYQSARAVAQRAVDQSMMVAIGGGDECPADILGRVLNVAVVSKAYGDTNAFLTDPEQRTRLSRWPVATALLDVYEVVGHPRLIEDLRFPDRSILKNAFDQVIRPEPAVAALWNALVGHGLRLVDLPPIEGFREPDKPTPVGTRPPAKLPSKEEGQRIWKEMLLTERDRELPKFAKVLNRERNGGRLTCEACRFSDEMDAMLDAHHRVPLQLGARRTVVSDFAILCPTCHRWAHSKATNKLKPLTPIEIAEALNR